LKKEISILEWVFDMTVPICDYWTFPDSLSPRAHPAHHLCQVIIECLCSYTQFGPTA